MIKLQVQIKKSVKRNMTF